MLVAVGSTPRAELAKAAGLEIDDGVLVDQSGRTSSPDIYAIGDLARVTTPEAGMSGRLESVHGANDQARSSLRDLQA